MLLDFLFPRRCLGCGQWGGYFCSQCLNLVLLGPERICPLCTKPAVGGLTHPGCSRPWGLDGLTTIFTYQGLMEKAIKKLKYKFVSDLAQDLVELFLSFCGEDKFFSYFCQKENVYFELARNKLVYFLPVPLHPRRKRWRGFNQAELLGEMIASNLNLPFLPDLLVRVKNTKPQTKLDEEERKKNIRGAFKINPNSKFLIRNSRFILFDDVWTTGSTLRECGQVLKRAGAKEVLGLTLAR